MKVILKISMICGLLLSVFGTVDAARKYAPGVAMRMATTEDFDVSESEQILADLPEEWKKEHRSIVNQMRRGIRGRGAVKKTVTIDPEKEDVDEKNDNEETVNNDDNQKPANKDEISKFQEEVLAIKKFKPTEEDLEKSEKNDARLLKEMTVLLGDYIEKCYNVAGLDDYTFNKDFGTQYSAEEFIPSPLHYSKEYTDLITKFGQFIRQFSVIEKNLNSSNYFDNFLENINNLLTNLSELKDDNSYRATLIKTLEVWNRKRLKELDNKKSVEFEEVLNRFTEKSGAGKDKKDSSNILKQMNQILSNLIARCYKQSKSGYILGFRVDAFVMNDKWSTYSFEKISLDESAEDKDSTDLIESFNEFVRTIRSVENSISKKTIKNDDYDDLFKVCIKLLELLQANNSDKELCFKISQKIEQWYRLRMVNALGKENTKIAGLLEKITKK